MQQGFLHHGKTAPALVLRKCERKRAKFRQIREIIALAGAQSREGIAAVQHGCGGIEDLSLVVAEIEVEGHVSYSRGRPRMRSAIMLRWISAVPPAIVSL